MVIRRSTNASETISFVVPVGLLRARHAVARARHARALRDLMDGPLFDAAWYARTYPDLQTSGLSPRDHYAAFGVWENRDPSPLFSCRHYRRQVGRDHPGLVLDYLERGDGAGLMPNLLFDTVWYRRRYGVDAEACALLHYLSREQGSEVSPNPFFDPEWVARRYADRIPAGHDPLRFYLEDGNYETAMPSPYFDPVWYRERCPEACGYIPLAHYLSVGVLQGASPHPSVDGDFLSARLTATPVLA